MTTDLILPMFNMEMESGVLVKWLRSEGDVVEKGDPVAEVETDKVNMEVESTADGILFDLRYAEGDLVPVTATIARIAPDEAALAAARNAAGASATSGPSAVTDGAIAIAPEASPAEPGADAATPSAPAPTATAGESPSPLGALTKPRATPAVRRLARENGVELASVAVDGRRVSAADIMAAVSRRTAPATPAATAPIAPSPAPSPAAPPAVAPRPATAPAAPRPAAPLGRMPLDATRRAIAERMTVSNQAPQITLYVEARAGAISWIRSQATPRPSFSAIFAVAVARALRDHPNLNVTFEDGAIVPHAGVDLGIAVARPAGLIVPVLHDADRMNVIEADRAIRALVERARDGHLRVEDVTGGTFTITSLGEAGVDYFAPLLNPPQVGILGIGRLTPRAVVVDDAVRVEPTVILSLSCDHRVVDGQPGAAFLATLRGLIESPGWLADNLAAAHLLGS